MKPRQLFDFNEPVAGRRLKLVRLGAEHADYLAETYRNESFWHAYRNNQDRKTVGDQLARKLEFEYQQDPANVGKIEWLVQLIENDSKADGIGFAALSAFNRQQQRAEFQLGIVDPRSRNPGVGLEASLLLFDYGFNRAALHKLVSFVYADNEKSQVNTLALGFQQEGFLRAHFKSQQEDEFLDVYQNGMLNSEFRNNARLARLSLRLLGRDITTIPAVKSVEKLGSTETRKGSDLQASFQIKL